MAKGGRRLHSGRKPKPTALKVLQGTFRRDRHAAEVQHVEAKWPDPPAHLSRRERKLWRRIGRECGPWVTLCDWPTINGVVSLLDRLLTIQAAQRASEDAGRPLTADGKPNAEPAANPLYVMELKFWTALRGYIAILGLSPADRARMPAVSEPVENPLDRFIQRGRTR